MNKYTNVKYQISLCMAGLRTKINQCVGDRRHFTQEAVSSPCCILSYPSQDNSARYRRIIIAAQYQLVKLAAQINSFIHRCLILLLGEYFAPLRDYQPEISEKILAGHNDLIILPTGTGKTRIATNLIQTHLTHTDKGKAIFPCLIIEIRTFNSKTMVIWNVNYA